MTPSSALSLATASGVEDSSHASAMLAAMEARVQTAERVAEDATRELEMLLHAVSHDLKAPLRAVDGYSQILVEDFTDVLPEEGQRHLQTIRRSSKRFSEMIDRLVAYSRLSRAPLEPEPIETGRLVGAILEELGTASAEVHVGVLPPCEGDRGLLRQVWRNLLANALKFSKLRQPPVIEVGGRLEGSEILYFVRDNGIGFDMRYAHKLFGVFQRLHRADDYEGIGVGLAVVQRIIHRHGGRVWAEAAPDQPTTFFFTLKSHAP